MYKTPTTGTRETDLYEVQVQNNGSDEFEQLGSAFEKIEDAIKQAEKLVKEYKSTRVVQRNILIRRNVMITYG